MNICSNFHADIRMLNMILMLANFGPKNWFWVPGIGPGFYSFPHAATLSLIRPGYFIIDSPKVLKLTVTSESFRMVRILTSLRILSVFGANWSNSTPCKKAEFEHLHIFQTLLGFFLPVSGKIYHSPIKKVKRQPRLVLSL